ncbi:asparagine synthase-related protein [Moheibacter sediminis]|uniref:asparagine synthase (glutamine-hydrolyzing) n=1 Tax=Moheibacter sediminis TaxID=1434700 RepID=A0A1W1YGE0_9FLAO|nr:asparagine synthase-related protein [Moheibacter sediminis]SMC35290.1 Asparagine synthetase B (glutamine-hydrolyzing) [Moheibacter sediminis]
MDKGFGIIINQNQLIKEVRFSDSYFDNISFESDSFEFALEGVVINYSKLLSAHAASQRNDLFSTLFHKYGMNFLNELEGEFCGYLHDKAKEKIYLFMNFTATRKLFYYQTDNLFIADTSLLRLKEKLEKSGISTQFNKEAAYSILVCSNLLENMTPLEGAKRLMDREYVEFDLKEHKFELKEYFSLENISRFSGTKSQAIDLIHETFEEGVRLEYSKDESLNLNHFALLSGGLDSRMAVLYANRLGYKLDEVLCFSQKGYLDAIIARQISEKYNLPFLFVPLNGGEYLKDVDKVTAVTEGTGRFTGGVHTNYAYQFINKENLGLIHSGQLGDGVLGGFNKSPFKISPSKEKIVYSEFLFDKFAKPFQKITNEYDSEELFLLRNVGYNRAVLGSFMAEDYSYQTSPFMTSFFLKLAVSLPESWKFKQKLYLEWLNKHCAEASQFRWERTLLKPNAAWKTKFGDIVMTRAYSFIQEKILQNHEGSKMGNYEYYYDRNKDINGFINGYYNENISKIKDLELCGDMSKMYNEGSFEEKMLVITVLASNKYLFG